MVEQSSLGRLQSLGSQESRPEKALKDTQHRSGTPKRILKERLKSIQLFPISLHAFQKKPEEYFYRYKSTQHPKRIITMPGIQSIITKHAKNKT